MSAKHTLYAYSLVFLVVSIVAAVCGYFTVEQLNVISSDISIGRKISLVVIYIMAQCLSINGLIWFFRNVRIVVLFKEFNIAQKHKKYPCLLK